MGQLTRIRPQTKQNSREQRLNMSEAERRLWQSLRLRQIEGHKFRRQHPIGRYIVDFVCLECGLVVEVDGGQHSEHQDYDEVRTEWLRQRGFRVIRFWNHEVMNNIEGVKAVIWQSLRGGFRPPSQPSPWQGEGDAGQRGAVFQGQEHHQP